MKIFFVHLLAIVAGIYFSTNAYSTANIKYGQPGGFYIFCSSILLIIAIYPLIIDSFIKESCAYWYSGTNTSVKSLNWNNIQDIINNDPLDRDKKLSLINCTYAFTRYAPVVFILPMLPRLFRDLLSIYTTAQLTNVTHTSNSTLHSSSLTVIIAIATAILSFYYNSRITARTKSRIKWINNLRDEMSVFFGTIENKMYKPDNIEFGNDIPKQMTKKFNQNNDNTSNKLNTSEIQYEVQNRFQMMSKLELLLNPSEKLHRTLIALMRLALGLAHLDIDQIVFDNLNYSKGSVSSQQDYKFACATWQDGEPKLILYKKSKDAQPIPLSYDTLLSQLFRIATAILKTEWEQTKNIK